MSRHVDSPDFIVRPLETSAERDAYTLLSVQTFSPHVDAPAALPHRRRFVEENPAFQPHHLRGAFIGNTFLGGYHIDDRVLCIGPTRLRTGCIGGVATVPEHRNQGVAAALLRDAVTYAQNAKDPTHSLLLLNGIANFYHRFDFIDVFDITYHTIASQAIQSQIASSPTPYTTRLATFEDIPALFALHQRHYAAYAGSFERDQAFQERLFHQRGGMKPYLALDSKGTPRGYLLLHRRPELEAYEVAADTWDATLALLKLHVSLLEEHHSLPPEAVVWPLPPDSPTYYLLADHLSVKSQTVRTPDADWMARVGNLPTLVDALLPLWNERWQQNSPVRSGVIALTIDDTLFLLGADAVGIHLLDPMTSSAHAARYIMLSQHVFTQLLFGYRPISWAMQQAGQTIPADLSPVLTILFPKIQTWIAGSDAF